MDMTTILIVVLVILLLGGGWYGRSRWRLGPVGKLSNRNYR